MTVVKKSGKPFKSGFKSGTVVDECVSPYTEKPAYLMDDGSIVDQYVCMEIIDG